MSVPNLTPQGSHRIYGQRRRPRKRSWFRIVTRSFLVLVVLSTLVIGAVRVFGYDDLWRRASGGTPAADTTANLGAGGAVPQPPAPVTTTPPTKDAGPDAVKPPTTGNSVDPVHPVTNPGVADQPANITVDDADILKLVNRTRSLPSNYVPAGLVAVRVRLAAGITADEKLMKPEAAQALESLMQAAEQDKVILYAVSGYRSYATQKWLYEYRVKVEGQALADLYTARPGQSEHQTGLAMDLAGADGQLEESFGQTTEGIWLANNAHRFGFIIRYPQGKETTTGYNYEPWHLRYVGVKAATEIAAQGLVLEEYLK